MIPAIMETRAGKQMLYYSVMCGAMMGKDRVLWGRIWQVTYSCLGVKEASMREGYVS